MPRGRALVGRSSVAVVAVAVALFLAACGANTPQGNDADIVDTTVSSSDSSGGAGKRPGEEAKNADRKGQERLRLGATAAQPTEFTLDDKTGRFDVSVDGVEMGKPGSLDEASTDPDKFRGKVAAWVRMTYTHVGGHAPAEVSTSSEWSVRTTRGERGKPLVMLLGELPEQPKGCRSAAEMGAFERGEKATLCQPFVVPEGSKLREVLLNRGFTTPPTSWTVN